MEQIKSLNSCTSASALTAGTEKSSLSSVKSKAVSWLRSVSPETGIPYFWVLTSWGLLGGCAGPLWAGGSCPPIVWCDTSLLIGPLSQALGMIMWGINVQMRTGCGWVALEDPSEVSWVHTATCVVFLGTNLLCILKKAAKYNCINKWRQQLPGVLEEVAASGNACWEGRLNSNEGNGFEMLPDRERLGAKCWQQTRAWSHSWC